MKICQKCGKKFSDDGNFCLICGAPLVFLAESEDISTSKNDNATAINDTNDCHESSDTLVVAVDKSIEAAASVNCTETYDAITDPALKSNNVNPRSRSKIQVPTWTLLMAAALMAAVAVLLCLNGAGRNYTEDEILAAIEAIRIDGSPRMADKISALVDLESKYNTFSLNASDIAEQIQEADSTINDVRSYIANKDELERELTDLSDQASHLDSQIESQESTLESLKNQIYYEENKPITLTPGYYIVGTHIEPGYYTVTGDSNLFVYSSDGHAKVNTILGGSYGVESYTCNLSSGDIIQAEGKDTFAKN